MTLNKIQYNYFLFLFSIIPISIVIGQSVSLINILLIDISFIILMILNKNFSFFQSKSIKYFFILYIYLIFNSIISTDYTLGLYRNIGFLRMIILFMAFNFFFTQKYFFDKVFKFWLLVISIILVDTLIESFFGQNILGYGEQYGRRLVSFFKDEPIVGGFLNSFYLLLIGYLFLKSKKINNYKIYLFSLFFLLVIFLTGERANSIKALLGVIIFFSFFSEFNLKKKILILITFLIVVFVSIKSSTFLENRFIDQIRYMKTGDSLYFKLYKSGYQVFQNYRFFGVGNKNYRFETCKNAGDSKVELQKNKNSYLCSTHPHQIYFEFLSEHGIFGSIILFFVFYKLLFRKIKYTVQNKNYLQLGCLVYLVLIFLPLIPSGAFFGNYVLSLFMINMSIFYGCDKNLNIFLKI